MAMVWRNWIAFVAILATVLSILSTLSVLQYDAILTRLIQERMAVIAETTASSFRSVINLGLPISAVRNANEILVRAKDIDPAISSIQVFHQTGIVVHATLAFDKATVPKDILLVQSLSSGDRWNTENSDELFVGLTLRDTAGVPVGGILVAASNLDLKAASKSMVIRIGLAAGIVFFVFSAFALFVLRLRLGGVIRGLERLEQLSEEFSDDQNPEERAATEPIIANYGFLSGEIAKFELQLIEAFKQFRSAREKLIEVWGHDIPSTETVGTSSDASGNVLASIPETSLARAFARNITPWAAIIILGSALVLGLFVHDAVTHSFEPELAARTNVIGAVANKDIQRAVNAGVPLPNLVGAENYFHELLQHFPEVSYFGIATGRIIFEAGTRQESVFAPKRTRKDVTTFPITSNGAQIGYIIIDANPGYFSDQFRGMLLDFGVVILVVLLLAFQIMTVVMSRSLTAPFMRLQYLAGLQATGDFSKVVAARGLTAIDRLSDKLSQHAVQLHFAFTEAVAKLTSNPNKALLREFEKKFSLRRWRPDRLEFSYLNDVRLPLFLFAAADELPLAFFPLYTRAANNPLTWLDPAVVISLPLAAYLIAIVFGSPLARSLAERFGHRKLILFAVVPTFLAQVGLYFSTDVIEIIIFRAVTGLGYAIVTLSCQDYVLDAVPEKERNRSLGLFTAALFSGIFAGAALGGVLADRLGQHAVFSISAALVLISGFLAYRLLPAQWKGSAASAIGSGSFLPPIWKPLRNHRFAALVFGIAIPANILLQAFISFLVALELNALGASTADTGRILMTYFLAIVFVGPAAPRLLENRLCPAHVGLLGALLSVVSLCIFVFWPASWSMLVAVAGAGVAHSLVRDPQVAVAMEIAEYELPHLGSNSLLSSLRTLERLGSLVGLIAIALISSFVGYVNAIAVIAGLVLTGAVAFAFVFRGNHLNLRSRRIEESQPAERD